ncbi:hypothetical protein H2248_003477 [Termitomyces sp. 'cryptogamus']|nr:hypothetical protein H2248_003477 [Termitomyces sp. 'cryptogamus']
MQLILESNGWDAPVASQVRDEALPPVSSSEPPRPKDHAPNLGPCWSKITEKCLAISTA